VKANVNTCAQKRDIFREKYINTKLIECSFKNLFSFIFRDDLNSLHNFMAQLMAQFNRDMEDPVKEIRRMDFSPFDSDEFRKKFFKEEVEIKDDNEDSYADIKIPDFKDGRRGRFIHDFKNNQTTIIDEDAARCFVYPLDYSTTLPPKSMIDVIVKMRTGYYFPDTNVLRKEMRVITPPLDLDDEYISARTKLTCSDMSIYRLEPIVRGVYKRSITEISDHGKFAEFSGKGIVEIDIANIGEI
jgi:BRICHOS domain